MCGLVDQWNLEQVMAGKQGWLPWTVAGYDYSVVHLNHNYWSD